jgi:hypothetical protein
MSSARKASLRELASAAYELDASVTQGVLRREGDRWMVGDETLDAFLESFDGDEVTMIVASVEGDRPIREKLCRTCGTEYQGIECPRCRSARIRLRGR